MTRHLLRIVASSFIAITSASAQFPETATATGPPDTLQIGQVRAWSLGTDDALDHSPYYSPDGDSIAFSGGIAGARIWIRASDGSGTARQVTFGDGSFRDWYGNFSPDGRNLCFSSDRDGVDRLWTVSLDDGELKPLAELGMSMGNVPPAWSPDGSRIAYTALVDGNRDIYTISPDGGAPRRITNDPLNDDFPTWAADSQTLFYVSARDSDSIWQIPSTGGNPWSIPTGKTSVIGPKPSPDGRWLLFRAGPGGIWHTWIIPSEGGEALSVTTADSVQGWAPDWAPDGTHIAYTRGLRGGAGELVVFAGASGTSRTLADSIVTFAAGPFWSPDGTRITCMSMQRDLLVVDVATGNIDTLATIDQHSSLYTPNWSPDGEWIAFASAKLGDLNLWLVPSSGGEAEPITLGPGLHVRPVWAPDGETMFYMHDPLGAGNIWSTTMWGDPPTPLLEDQAWVDIPLFVRAEEGDLIINRIPGPGTDGTSGYWSLPLDGGNPRRLYDELFPGSLLGSGGPTYNLRRIAEADHTTGSLWVRDPADAEPRLLFTDNVRNPQFSPDGEQITYIRLKTGDWHGVYVADVRQITGTHALP